MSTSCVRRIGSDVYSALALSPSIIDILQFIVKHLLSISYILALCRTLKTGIKIYQDLFPSARSGLWGNHS